jgi:uncharacterized cupin superfamily protein
VYPFLNLQLKGKTLLNYKRAFRRFDKFQIFAKFKTAFVRGYKMEVKIEKPDEKRLKELKVENWPIWSKEVSRFDWYYGETEMCYILEGRVIVELPNGEKIEIKAGDLVTFPKGLSCVWDIKEPIRKHYTFLED